MSNATLSVVTPIKKKAFSLWILPIGLSFVVVALLATTPIGNYDLGTDLKTGQWILNRHGFPQKDVFTYTCNQNDYLDGKVLYQTVLYLLYLWVGYKGLSLANTFAVLCSFLLLFLRLRLASNRFWLTCLLLVISALTLERRFFLRAEIISWILLNLTLLVMELYWRKRRDFLWALPILQAVWVNTEGLFILGWLIMGAYFLGEWVDQRKPDLRLLRLCVLSLAASLLNPYGFKLWKLPFLYFSEFQGSANSDLISPLNFLSTQNLRIDWNIHIFLYFSFSLALGLCMVFSWRQIKIHEWLLAVVFFYLSCLAYRNIPFLMLVTVPLLAQSWENLLARSPSLNKADHFLKETPVLPLLTAFLMLLLSCRILTNAYYTFDRRQAHLGLGLDEGRVPVKAVEFLNQNHLEGRMLNNLDLGDWLVWDWSQPVFIDGRQQVVSRDLYDEYKQASRLGGLFRLIIHYQPQLIGLQYNDAVPWAVQLKMMPDWRLIYADGANAIYAQKDFAPQIPTLSFPSLLRANGISPDPAGGAALVQNAESSKWGSWFSGFYKPQYYPMGLMSLGLLALHYQEYETAEAFFVESLSRGGNGYSEVFFNLGVANLHLQRYPLGKLCLEKSLALDPGNPETLKMLESLRDY